MATIKQIEALDKKFKNLVIKVEQASDKGQVEIFSIRYQQNGIAGRISEGLKEANAVWDERKSRPKGYIVAHGSEIGNGEVLSVMVSEEYYDSNAKAFKEKVAALIAQTA